MAINLNPGADATLVTAATRAGLATVPEDYSKTFQSVADSYDKTMEANAKVWKNITDVVALVGIDMVENAKEFMDYKIKGAGLNPDSATFLVSELEANKQEQKDLGFLGGTFGNKETRQRKAELKIKQNEIFADIDMAAESISAGAEAVASNLYDFRLAPYDSEMINAIIKSNLKDKTTKAGNTAVLSRDEKTDELMFTLLGKGGKPMDPPQTMTIKEFNKSIATNVMDTKNVTGQALNTLNNNIANAGAASTSGVYDPQMKQMNLNNLDAITSTPTDLKRAMLTPFGYSNTSFYDDIISGDYPDLYASLLKSTGSKREIAVEHSVVEGIEDTDNDGFISQEEISNDYSILAANILGMKNPEISKEYFKEYTSKKLESAFNYGHSKRTPAGGIETKTNPYGLSLSTKGKYGLGLPSKGTSYVPQYDVGYVNNKINNLKSGTEIAFQGSNYTFREVDGKTQWWKDYGYGDNYGEKVEGVGIGTPVGTAQDMAKDVFHVDDPIFTSIVTEREAEVPDDKTGLLPSENPFADYQSKQARTVPTAFVDAFKKDFQSDQAVVKHLKEMNVPGLVVGTYQGGGKELNYPNNDNRKLVEGTDTAYDDIILTLNGKTKLFTTDPSFSDDTEGAQEIWNWLYENFSGTQASSNNDYYNLIDKD